MKMDHSHWLPTELWIDIFHQTMMDTLAMDRFVVRGFLRLVCREWATLIPASTILLTESCPDVVRIWTSPRVYHLGPSFTIPFTSQLGTQSGLAEMMDIIPIIDTSDP